MQLSTCMIQCRISRLALERVDICVTPVKHVLAKAGIFSKQLSRLNYESTILLSQK